MKASFAFALLQSEIQAVPIIVRYEQIPKDLTSEELVEFWNKFKEKVFSEPKNDPKHIHFHHHYLKIDTDHLTPIIE